MSSSADNPETTSVGPGDLDFSEKGKKLIHMYEDMANNGYNRVSQPKVEVAYQDFELKF